MDNLKGQGEDLMMQMARTREVTYHVTCIYLFALVDDIKNTHHSQAMDLVTGSENTKFPWIRTAKSAPALSSHGYEL
jgi:hypothetical protein